MKITLLAFAVIFLTASTFAQSSHDIAVETSSKSTVISSSASSTEAPTTTTKSSSTAPTTTSSSSTAPTTTSSSSSEPTTSSSSEPTTASTTPPETTTSSTSSEPTTTATSTTPETTTSHETTSVAPTSSTEPPITSTSPPIPVPQPGYWNITDGNTTCIRASMAIRFKVELKGVNYLVLSPVASSKGSKCNTTDGTEVLVLTDKDNNVDFNISFVFEKSSDSIYVKNITFTYLLSSSEAETFTNDTHFFEVKAGSSYLCNTQSNVVLGNATMEIISLQIQAFGSENNKDFGSAEECVADNPINDIVPIAVGVALLALVVVVLIAYLVGRRRSRQKGYQSV